MPFLGILFLLLGVISFGAAIFAGVRRFIVDDKEEKKEATITFFISLVLMMVFSFLSCIRIVPPGHVGVAVTMGYIQEKPLNPGTHLVWPITSVTKMDVRTQAYTMSKVDLEGQTQGDDAIDVLSSDGLTLKLDVTVWFRLIGSDAARIYRTVGVDYVNKIVRPAVRAAFRDAAVKILAVDIYSEKRETFVEEVRKLIESQFADRGIIVEQVLLRNVDLPQTVKQAIEAKLAAEQEAMKMQFVLQKERQEAERKRIEAAGLRDAQQIIAQSLTPAYLHYYQMKIFGESFGQGPNNSIILVPYGTGEKFMLQLPAPK